MTDREAEAQAAEMQAAYERGKAESALIEHRYRRLLWLVHGHIGLYGDDGEMQCSLCAPTWDYKRMPLADVEAAANSANLERIAQAFQQAQAVAAPKGEGQ